MKIEDISIEYVGDEEGGEKLFGQIYDLLFGSENAESPTPLPKGTIKRSGKNTPIQKIL